MSQSISQNMTWAAFALVLTGVLLNAVAQLALKASVNETGVIGFDINSLLASATDLIGNIWVNTGEVDGDGKDNDANGLIDDAQMRRHCQLSDSDTTLMENAIDQLGLSVRAYHRVLRVSRTIADLDDAEQIASHHLIEALGYRQANIEL